MKSTKFFKKISIFLCAMMIVSALASCGEEKSSSVDDDDESTDKTSSVASVDGSNDDESAEDDATSEDATSEDATSEDATSEETSSETIDNDKKLAAFIALEKLEEDYNGKFALELEGSLTLTSDILASIDPSFALVEASGSVSGKEVIYIDNSGDVYKECNISSIKMEISVEGENIAEEIAIRSVTIGEESYIIYDEDKTYSKDVAQKGILGLSMDNYVETKEVIYEGETYTVDRFAISDEETISIYTKDGQLVYIEEEAVVPGFAVTLKVSINHDISGADFEIPSDYTEF